ncbi:MAG: carboxypeptidase-like regulatory domain-containing protein [Aureispira sp.]
MEGIVAQSITITSTQQPLEVLLQQLHEEYDCSISYDAKRVGDCTINLQQEFEDIQTALEAIVQQCTLELKVVNGVFIMVQESANSDERPSYSFKGTVLDAETEEPLPFATVVINQQALIADENGKVFSNCPMATVVVEVAHLGYYNLKQECHLEKEQRYLLPLEPAATQLEEILVETREEKTVSNGQEGTGISQLNAARLPFLAGNTTNSLFAYLRLQAGILAAGEPEKDFILWGSYKGQSHLLYDGITLFSPTTYNNVLGMVNPAFVQAVEVHKGGQQVDIGDRVGGVVHLHSSRGSLQKNRYEIGGSNQLVDAYANIGLRNKGNFQIGFRHVLPHQLRGTLIGIPQQPFFFSDLHLKYNQFLAKGWSIKGSALANYDISEKTRLAKQQTPAPAELVEGRGQWFAGGSVQVYKDWQKWGQTRFQLSSSSIDFTYRPNWFTFSQSNTNPYIFENEYRKGITEARLQIEQTLPATCWHQPSFGLEGVYQYAYLEHPIPATFIPELRQEGKRLQGYVKDRIYVLPNLTAEAGIKWTLPLWQTMRLFLQPRLNVTYTPHQRWKISWAMGQYQQFLTENSLIDVNNNHAYHWNVATSKETPILESHHQVLHLSYVEKSFQIRLNGYYKSFKNLSKFKVGTENPLYGKARSYGLDAQIAYNKPHYNFWVAYNLGKTEESFCPSCNDQKYRPALHDQRQELKVAGMFRWKYFTLSANYVFGSGLLDFRMANRQVYSRLDAALLFEYQLGQLKVEAGLSVLNLLNTYNRPYLSYQSNSLYNLQTNLHKGVTLFLRTKF